MWFAGFRPFMKTPRCIHQSGWAIIARHREFAPRVRILLAPCWSFCLSGNPGPNLLAPPKSNNDTKHDGLENVSAFKYGYFVYLWKISRGLCLKKALFFNLFCLGCHFSGAAKIPMGKILKDQTKGGNLQHDLYTSHTVDASEIPEAESPS